MHTVNTQFRIQHCHKQKGRVVLLGDFCKSNYVDDVICYIGIFVVIVVGISFLNELELVICNGRRCVSGRE